MVACFQTAAVARIVAAVLLPLSCCYCTVLLLLLSRLSSFRFAGGAVLSKIYHFCRPELFVDLEFYFTAS